MALRCLACGQWGRDPANGGRCACGALSWVETSPPPLPKPVPPRRPQPPSPPRPQLASAPQPPLPREPHTARLPASQPTAQAPRVVTGARRFARHVRLADTTERMVVHRYDDAELARVLQGIREGGTVILAGQAGVGKSTVAAELASAVAAARGGLSYWLDRDQGAHDLIAALFERVDAPMDRIVLVEERDPAEPGYEPLTASNVLTQVPSKAACLVVDSLETWTSTYADQATFARAVMGHSAAVKLILAGTNATGEIEGIARLRRVGDAIVVLDPTSWLVSKCRWLPGCPQRIARRRMTDGSIVDDEDESALH